MTTNSKEIFTAAAQNQVPSDSMGDVNTNVYSPEDVNTKNIVPVEERLRELRKQLGDI